MNNTNIINSNLQIKCLQTGLSNSNNFKLKQFIANVNILLFNNIGSYVNYFNKELYNYLITITLTNSVNMAKINTKLQGINKSTNVLSLQLYSIDDLLKIKQGQTIYLGDIYICLDTTKLEAAQLNINFNQHITRLYIHGFLHLLGFDHNNNTQATAMYNIENVLLSKCLQHTNIKGLVSNFWYH